MLQGRLFDADTGINDGIFQSGHFALHIQQADVKVYTAFSGVLNGIIQNIYQNAADTRGITI